ncbi:FkbM family methyltransferase [Atlantibacter hermannii]|uniref:FkbM family methyltransferase n=1 Tax=Atlantibacter hermannii TaxID=565 RepID=UPI0028AEF994|nr:FkbM family methyltransferase [Atlantibacter hermannii]
MKVISYSQNFEDIMLWRALNHIEKGYYIDVGAAWPTYDSVTKLFYDAGWRGVNIEPNLNFFSQYEHERAEDLNLNIAISDKKGRALMNFINNTGLSTLNSEVMKKHADLGFQNDIKEVEVLTLNDIFNLYIPPNQEVHFLKIDVEGFENEVISGCNWSLYRPWILVIEATVPMSQEKNYNKWESILLEAGYDFVYKDGLNRFYVAKEHSELNKAFENPPNVFDSFINYSEFCKNEQINKLTQELEQKHKKNESLNNRISEIKKEKNNIENDVILLKREVNDFFHANWHLQNQLILITNSRSWKITRPLRILRKFIHFFKNFDKKESPRKLINFTLFQLNKFPRFKSLVKTFLIKSGLKNHALRIIYNNKSNLSIIQTGSMSDHAMIIKGRLESVRTSLTPSERRD